IASPPNRDAETVHEGLSPDGGAETNGSHAEEPQAFAFFDEPAQEAPVERDVWADEGPREEPRSATMDALAEPRAEAAAEFDFFGEPAASKPGAPAGGAFEDELKAIFQQEAR